MYTSTLNRYKTACQLRWYIASDVITYLYQMKDFVLVDHIKQSPTLPSVSPNMVFGSRRRFPEGVYFICEGIGAWNSRLQRIQLLTCIITNNHRIQRQYNNLSTLGDAEIALLDCINDAIHAFENTTDLVDQPVFETRYNLTWVSNELEQTSCVCDTQPESSQVQQESTDDQEQ